MFRRSRPPAPADPGAVTSAESAFLPPSAKELAETELAEAISLDFTPEELSGEAFLPDPEPEVIPAAEAEAPAPRPSWLGVPVWGWWTGLGLVLLLGGLAASWFALPIRQMAVTGNKVLSAAEVKALSGATPGYGWLYYGKGRASGLLANPWIQSATVTRHFPDSVEIAITERQPALRLTTDPQKPALVSADAQVLPWKPGYEKLPAVSGWGPSRLSESVLVTRALSRYTVQSVAYTPAGLSVTTAGGTAWSGDLKSLVKYAGSISMYPNKKINIYPWGVSVQQ